MVNKILCVNYPGRTYFFKDNDYWEFSNVHMHVRRGYPRHIGSRWLNCSATLKHSNKDHHGTSGTAHTDFRLSTVTVFTSLLLAEFVRAIATVCSVRILEN